MLYRLDYLAPSGTLTAVPDPIMGGPRMATSYARARELAREEGNRTGAVIRITSIRGAGSLRATINYSGETNRFHKIER